MITLIPFRFWIILLFLFTGFLWWGLNGVLIAIVALVLVSATF